MYSHNRNVPAASPILGFVDIQISLLITGRIQTELCGEQMLWTWRGNLSLKMNHVRLRKA